MSIRCPPTTPCITPRSGLAETKVPDATPGAIAMYALDDEQELLARVRCICRPIAAQFIGREKIALFSFEEGRNGEAKILNERHYLLVAPDRISQDDLERYRKPASRASG